MRQAGKLGVRPAGTHSREGGPKEMLLLAEELGAGLIVVWEREPGPFEAHLGKDFSGKINRRASCRVLAGEPVIGAPGSRAGEECGRGAVVDARGLQFWFEFGSTYSYLSAARLGEAAGGAGVEVEWEPFLLGPIFKQQGWDDSPFNVYPAKGRYMWRDVERLCAGYGIPFAKPSRFPRSGLLAARVACLAKSSSATWLPDFARAVFRANFAEDREIGDADVVRSVLDSIGQPGARILERAGEPETKAALRAQTERAVKLGIFGAPSFVVDGELFWGDDRLEDALLWAGPRVDEGVAGGGQSEEW